VGGAARSYSPPTENLFLREKGEVPNSENLVSNSSKLVPKYW
jgi:hypothetical protein